MAYIVKDGDEGNCPCGRPLKLLTHRDMPDGWPAFLICFPCEEVTQVDGDDGQVVQYKGGKRKKFLRPLKKKDDPDVRSLQASAARRRRHRRK